MSDTLNDKYKELWIQYQNEEAPKVQNLTYDQLIERISKWEAIEFEARAKRQRGLAEKRTRDIVKAKSERDALISNPHYTPTKVEKPVEYKVREPKKRQSKEEKLKESFGNLGLDLGELLKLAEKKKSESIASDMENKE